VSRTPFATTVCSRTARLRWEHALLIVLWADAPQAERAAPAVEAAQAAEPSATASPSSHSG